MVGLESQRWSLARQLVMLQLCVVVTAVTIEAMVAIYRPAGNNPGSWEERQILGLVTLTEVALLVGIAGSLFLGFLAVFLNAVLALYMPPHFSMSLAVGIRHPLQ